MYGSQPMSEWSPTSWQSMDITQHPAYPDEAAVARVVEHMASLPPLVTSWEIEALKQQLGKAARGENFLLQGGDCAESFAECHSDGITAKLKILLQMSLVLVHATRKHVIRVGRIAGQYAKPRSANTETVDGVTLPTYRGDLVNRPGFTEAERTPDPELMLRGYERASLTLNFIRALAAGGFADLHHPEYWDLSFFSHADSDQRKRYESIVDQIRQSISFMEAVTGRALVGMKRVDFYTSHEGLALYYEQAQTRTVPRREGYYNLSTHLPWIGMRTAQLDSAHVEFFSGIRNPVAVKVGPAMDRDWLLGLIDKLHPDDEPGRLTLIHRVGAQKVADKLPELLDIVKESGKTVLWCCDPMHGNTEKTPSGYKTRRFENILSELEQSFEIHEAAGTVLGGVHFELTGDDVTECIGGARGLDEADLERAYRSQVDPRLNCEQALEMAMCIATHLGAMNNRKG